MERFPEQRPPKGGRHDELSDAVRENHAKFIRELKQQETQYAKDDPASVSFLKEELASIDFTLLKEIIFRYARKSGVSEDHFNWPDPSNIKILPNTDLIEASAMYDPISNTLSITPELFTDIDGKILSRPDELPRLSRTRLLFVVAHEYLHATGLVVLSDFKSEHSKFKGKHVQHVVGYATEDQYLSKRGKTLARGSMFNLFNEGITTRMTDQIVEEYLRRSGTSELKGIAILLQATHRNAPLRYVLASEIIEDITEKIASNTGISKEVVWEGFVSSYFNGDWYLVEDTLDLFEETVGKEVLEEIADMQFSDEEEVRRLRQKIRKGLPPMREELGRRWLKAIYPEAAAGMPPV
jgi:hypothetical protein